MCISDWSSDFGSSDLRTRCCCHCRDCQKQSGSAFGMSLILPRRALALEQGELAVWSHRSARGSAKHAHFCPLCGGRIVNDAGAASLLVSVKAGTLDETADLRPAAHLWTKRAQRWLRLSEALNYEAEPERDEDLDAAFRGDA